MDSLEEFIHLNSVDSTNRFLRDLAKTKNLRSWTSVYADYQSDGRGQRGNNWESVPGENLLCSIYYKPVSLKVQEAFLINQWVALTIIQVLQSFGINNALIKWPNDVLINKSKVCGVLTENVIVGNLISESVIGIGINVNHFPSGLSSTSMKNELRTDSIHVKEVLNRIVFQLRNNTFLLERNRQQLEKLYLKNLYGYQYLVPLRSNQSEWLGQVIGLLPSGKIRINKEGQILEFDFKEVEWVGLTS